jgi:hypothetical protein
MKFTRRQVKFLKIYQRLHRKPPTVLGLLWLGRLNWILLLPVIAVGLSSLLAAPPGPEVGYLMIGMCVGAFFRDVGRNIASVRFWPVIEQVVSWEKVDQAVAESEKA